MTTYQRTTVETFRVTFGAAVFGVQASTPFGAAVAAAAKIACRMTPVPAIALTLSHETRDRAEVRITEERAPGVAPAAGAWEIRFTVERDEPAEVWTLAETH